MISNTAQQLESLAPNYKKIAIEPNLTQAVISPSLAADFDCWILNDGYIGKYLTDRNAVQYSKPKMPNLTVNHFGVMNEACLKRYAVFLKTYLRIGRKFIENLRIQTKVA